MPDAIRIKITKDQGDQSVSTKGTHEPNVDSSLEASAVSLQQKAVNAAIINVGKQMMGTAISNFGAVTGNYEAVRRFDFMAGMAADAMMIATGGPVGAVYVAGKYINSAIQGVVDQRIRDREHTFMTERLGRVSVRGSR